MAYISQDEKKAIAPAVKAILKKYNLKGSLSIYHYSTLVLTIKEGSIDFLKIADAARKQRAEETGNEYFPVEGSIDVNTYHLSSSYSGDALNALEELESAMRGENWFDKSDLMTDYYHVKHYTDIKIGRYDKPYKYKLI